MTDAAPTDAALVVRLGADRWSIPVAAVIEVLRGQTLTRVPGADPVVLGLVNHRGRVLTVGDPARALGVADAGATVRDLVVVEPPGHPRFAIVVDAAIELAGDARTGLAPLDLDMIAIAIFA